MSKQLHYDHITDTSSLDRATAYRIVRASRLLRIHLQRLMDEVGAGISPEQWFVLFRIHENNGLSPGELADPVLRDYSNITRMVDALGKKGFVERRQDPDDRRRYQVLLTEAGHAFMERMLGNIGDIRAQVFAGIDDDEIHTLLSILDRLEDNITE